MRFPLPAAEFILKEAPSNMSLVSSPSFRDRRPACPSHHQGALLFQHHKKIPVNKDRDGWLLQLFRY